ncbi:Uncharacterised protein [Mycobacteroides abscessus subsp. abscessus]|nr:Uncharacterised protein [Mycobacteroides abscessus subsp. abscessus]
MPGKILVSVLGQGERSFLGHTSNLVENFPFK